MTIATRQIDGTVDVVVVGAGFAGLYMLHKLRGLGLSARVIEAGDGVGGTWHWNRYPGARVDIHSMEYSFSFDPELEREWRWSERYAPQAELLAYANHIADRYDLRRDIKLDTRVTAATWDEEAQRWLVETDGGEFWSARWCVMATGCLSVPKTIDIPGIQDFEGTIHRTFEWPREGVDFTGLRVGVIGTGSSAVQTIPLVAEQAAQLTVFQRTPSFCAPAWNAPIAPEEQADWDANRDEYRAKARAEPVAALFDTRETLALETPPEERSAELERRWAIGGLQLTAGFADSATVAEANQVAANFVADKIRATVSDPAVAERLVPKTYPIATKRMCVDTGYYATFNRPNVELVDLRATPIERVTASGIRTSAGDYPLDAIIFATGFDAMTGALERIAIRGRDGRSLADAWAHGPRTYLGLTIAGFPNLFTVTGPGSPSVLTNMIMSIEQHVEWITDCIAWLGDHGRSTIEASPEAEAEWVAHVAEVAAPTLFPQANSWYMGANVPGKPRVFLPYVGGFPAYVEACNDVVANNYRGFALA